MTQPSHLVATQLFLMQMQAASHPQLGASMEQLALAYSLFTSASKVTEPESALHDATDSFRSLTPVQKSGMNELIKLVRDALLQAPAEAPAPTKGPVPGEHAARPPVTGVYRLVHILSYPTPTGVDLVHYVSLATLLHSNT